jgi:hypothetical protein
MELMSPARDRAKLTARSAVALVVGLTGILALAGYLIAGIVPAPHELVAFVRAGTLERNDVLPRADVLERINGLAAAAEVAKRLETSPWRIWRTYSVTAEGQMFVVRVRTPDVAAGERLVQVVQETLASELKQRYDAAIAPHRAYIVALEAEVRQLGSEASSLDGRAKGDSRASTAAVDRWVALTEIRKQLRDAQVFAAQSDPPMSINGVRRLDIDTQSRRLQLALTGAVVGFVGAVGGLIVLAVRSRAVEVFAGV